MVDNICQHLVRCKDERQIVRVFFERLSQWQQFLEKNGSNGLSMQSQIGLYGELYFLKTHLLSAPENFADELAFWTGPKNRQHDFQSGETAIEVKASTGKQQQKLTISSEQQLDETLVGNLFLYHLSLSLVDNQVNTLPALIAGLRQTLKAAYMAASAFEEALIARGYFNAQAWRYQITGYLVRGYNMFHVAEGFPRLTERDLPLGVGDLTYSISVSECMKFAIPIDEVISLIRRGAA
jgi:hypothetical protein